MTSDELWNLVPLDKNTNSSKGNKLPDWNQFFPKLSLMQYDSYKIIFSSDIMRKKFEACKAQNLNALWANEYLYILGNTKEQFFNVLEKNLRLIKMEMDVWYEN